MLSHLFQDPKAYVDALLEVHLRNADLVNKAFKTEPGFVASLDKVRSMGLREK